MFLNVDNVGAERMSSGRPATRNARLPSCSLVLGTTKSPRAATPPMQWKQLKQIDLYPSRRHSECTRRSPEVRDMDAVPHANEASWNLETAP